MCISFSDFSCNTEPALHNESAGECFVRIIKII